MEYRPNQQLVFSFTYDLQPIFSFFLLFSSSNILYYCWDNELRSNKVLDLVCIVSLHCFFLHFRTTWPSASESLLSITVKWSCNVACAIHCSNPMNGWTSTWVAEILVCCSFNGIGEPLGSTLTSSTAGHGHRTCDLNPATSNITL